MYVCLISRFVPRTSEAAHLYLMKGSGCSSTVGRSGSRQTVSLGTGCVYKGKTGDSCFDCMCLSSVNVPVEMFYSKKKLQINTA